ncbi:unnamed protein product [Brassica oleracea var. botrytis]|uniref:Actin-related protein 6 n=1 Tax=Brassica oleracea TaxID=3712 RepID=A0A3P6C188_BRAOL|nr:unnamed protein product [Brassica oleracea]
MSVLIVTSLGDIVIDLHSTKCPLTCKNFLKLCKIKYYNGCLFHTVQKDFTAQTGDPTGTGLGGDSIYKFLYGEQARFFRDEIHLDLKHSKTGTVAMASAGENLNASQFYFTLRDDLDYLDGKHTVFGEIAEGLDTLTRINEAYVDAKNRPYKNIRIKHTYILEDPFEDPTQLADMIPDASPEGKPKEEVEVDVRLEDDWVPLDEQLGADELEEIIRAKAAHSSAVVLESIGDIPEAEVKPPENVLFVCKLNPVTEDEDLHTIFSRFGTVISADVIRDFKTGDSLCYAFIEFEEKAACEQAYNKMDNALIDDRRIHVDFSQSVSKLWSQFRQKDSQKGKGNGCFKCGSMDHVAKDCVGGGNQASKFIVKDQNRQHGGGEGYDMVFEGDIAERPKREKSHDKDKIRRRSPRGYGEGKKQDRDEGRSPGGYDEGKRRDKDEGRSGRVYGEGKRRDRDEGDTEDKAASKYDGRRDHREDVRERDGRYDDGVSREKKHRERNERESREDEERRRRRRHEEMRDDRWSDKGRRRERRDRKPTNKLLTRNGLLQQNQVTTIEEETNNLRRREMSNNIVVLDNGGGLIKAGQGGERDPLVVIPNCLFKPLSSKKFIYPPPLSDADVDIDLTSAAVRRPIDRGYLINPDLQRDIWSHLFTSLLRITPTSSSLLLTEPPLSIPSVQRATDELVFEDFGFSSLYVANPQSLVHLYEASRQPGSILSRTQCSLVVDCGFSFTHAVPVLHNFTLNYAVKRIDLGGKAFTNYLKELVSYRSINVMDQTFLMDDAKEKLCFVSLDLHRDLNLARFRRRTGNVIKSTYVLPDGVTHTKGYLKDPQSANNFLTLGLSDEGPNSVMDKVDGEKKKADMNKNEIDLTNERFLVPETLFHPADLGMNQAGLAECIVRAVSSCHSYLQPVLYQSIILTGGSTLFPQLKERLERELRPLVPDHFDVKITTQEDPILGVWRGGSLLASSPDFESMCVTKAEYEELGSARCRRRFFH